MSVKEWEKVFEMSQDKNLYHNLCTSLFPTIHGENLFVASDREDFACVIINSFCCICCFWERLKALCQLPQTLPLNTGSARREKSNFLVFLVLNH